MKLVLASNNAHKRTEILQILGDGFTLLRPEDLGIYEEIPETGNTFQDNALQKANYLAGLSGYPVIADDSGLEVFALNGEPGVYSARYAGPQRSHEDNMNLLLRNLEQVQDRSSQFKTVIALVLEGKAYCFEGIVKGSISREKQGEKGFGYDPVFIPEGHTQSFAQMSDEEKNAISHRKRALEKLRAFLAERV
jgi:XTP/dITP diphosphohydrolase